MIDLIVFSVGTNRYSVKIENVQRIIQSTEATSIPNAHEYIDGMISYEDKVIKILNFRKLINMQTYESELITLFERLKQYHIDWLESLKYSIEKGVKFTETLDSHICELGKWTDSFTAYDDIVVEILSELIDFHKQLHLTASTVLEVCENDKEEALDMFNLDIMNIYDKTMNALDKFTNELSLVSISLQKFIIYDNNDLMFAIMVDSIEDIAHVDEDIFINASDDNDISEFLELDGVLDLNGVLINVIKTVKLPN